jgi:RNA polymerase sigma-70 factor (ECF subfamily)
MIYIGIIFKEMQIRGMRSLFPDEDFNHLISNRGELFLKYLFDSYYLELCKLAYKYVGREVIAEDIVQDVFINIWNKRFSLNCIGSIKPYLIKSVINASLNYIQSKFSRQDLLEEESAGNTPDNGTPHEMMTTNELNWLVKAATELLPDKCRIVFSLSRFSNQSNKEIADHLGISIKTVEAQMTIALRKIRQFLAKFGYFFF